MWQLKENRFFMCMYNSHECDCRKVFENLTEKEAFKKEKELIFYYRNNTNYRLTNQTDGGEGTSGWKPTNEFREKQSKIHKEQWRDKEFRERNTKIRNDPNGVYKSKEFRNKISSIVKGKNNPNYNHKWTQEMKDKLRIKQSDSGRYKNENNPKSKKIICVETGEVFDCIKFALNTYNVKDETSFSIALKERHRTAGGMHWVEYDEKYLDKNYRFKYLIQILCENKNANPMICLNDNVVMKNMTELSKELNVPVCKIKYNVEKYGYFDHENKKYVCLKEYKSRYI